jgi:hypothetical protein
MADPLTSLFGRPPFQGSGHIQDYFGPGPDLGYITQGRPEFIPEDGGYDPDLDVPSLLQQGVPFEAAMQLQGLRARLHAQGSQERMRTDTQGALGELSKIDPSRETFAKDLLGIFRKYPTAYKSKDFADQVEMIGGFAKMMPPKKEEKLFDLTTLKDPELIDVALAEGWDKLPEQQGAIRAFTAQTKKEQKMNLVKAGYTPEQVAEMEKSGTLTDIGVLHAMNQIKQKPERTIQPEAARFLSEQLIKSKEQRAMLSSPQGKLSYLQQKYANGDAAKTTFSKAQWDEAYRAAQGPNEYDEAAQLYMQMLGQTPTGVSQSTEGSAPVWPNRKLSEESESLPIFNSPEEVRKAGLPKGTRFRGSDGNTYKVK